MGTTQNKIGDWFDAGLKIETDFMIVVCDTYDWEDYPVYCTEKSFKGKYHSHNGPNMTRIMEVYDLNKDKEKQLKQHRTFNYPADFTGTKRSE